MKKHNGRARVLLIEDDATVVEALGRLLEEEYLLETATTAQVGLAKVQQEDFDVVLTDLVMPEPEDTPEPWGFEIIRNLRAAKPHLPVILVTAYHSADATIEAMKLGAFDYLTKPIDTRELLRALEKAVAARRSGAATPDPTPSISAGDTLVGGGRAMQTVYKEIGRVAARPVPVLIRGGPGTGKESVARYIHKHSDRADRPLLVVDCASAPEAVVESELFGNEAGGAIEGRAGRIGRLEQAHHGTIFLDEIGDLSLGTQAKLLRLLEERRIQRLGGQETIELDVRVIAATQENLELAVRERRLREDLYWRLNDAVIYLPGLRERREDIPDLVKHFIQRHGAELGSPHCTISPEALEYLKDQPWPNNVRQLEAVMRQALLLARGFGISLEIISKSIAQTGLHRPPAGQSLEAYIAEVLAKARRGELKNVQAAMTVLVQRELQRQALRLARGDASLVKQWLGSDSSTVRELIARACARSQELWDKLLRQMSTPRKRRVDGNSIKEQAGMLENFEQFAAGLAHEIRASLHPIGVRLLTLQKSLSKNAEAQKQAASLRNEIYRLDELVRSYLRLGRPAEPKLAILSAEPLLKDVRDLLAPQCEAHSVELSIGPTVETPFHGDANQLKQVLINLVKNAAEAVGQKGAITLRARAAQALLQGVPTEVVALEVEDTGPGIRREVQERLFDPFFSTKPEGTGLGLPIAARIVHKHGGALEFETQPGRGATFRVLLPASHDKETHAYQSENSPGGR